LKIQPKGPSNASAIRVLRYKSADKDLKGEIHRKSALKFCLTASISTLVSTRQRNPFGKANSWECSLHAGAKTFDFAFGCLCSGKKAQKVGFSANYLKFGRNITVFDNWYILPKNLGIIAFRSKIIGIFRFLAAVSSFTTWIRLE